MWSEVTKLLKGIQTTNVFRRVLNRHLPRASYTMIEVRKTQRVLLLTNFAYALNSLSRQVSSFECNRDHIFVQLITVIPRFEQ